MSIPRLLPALLAVSVCAAAPVTHAQSAVEQTASQQAVPAINVWVDDATLGLVVQQFAQLTGRQLEVVGVLDERVSGRFTGPIDDVLSRLVADYSVLFDRDDNILRAVRQDAQSSVSIALAGPELDAAFKDQLLDDVAPGNQLEFRDDAVRVSGHPAFVKRMTKIITETLADIEARERQAEAVSADAVTGNGHSGDQPGLADVSETNIEVKDAGVDQMLADMQDEQKPASEQATLQKPIRWVTDIPGYTTF